jgi:uncharacterized repeat protein (TIGR03803 family)
MTYQITRTSLAMAILVFAVATSTDVHAQTYSVLTNFHTRSTVLGTPAPAFPGVVAQGRDGNLYSTTAGGGFNVGDNSGTIFQVTPAGTLKIVHGFRGVAPAVPMPLRVA